MVDQRETFVYLGNWDRTKAPSEGSIHVHRFDEATGALTHLKSVFPGISVGCVALDATHNVFFCTDEDSTHPGYVLGGGGLVYSFALDPATGDLTEIGHQPSYGTLPAYCVLDPSGEYLLVTHHTTANPVTRTIKDESGAFRITLEYDASNIVLFPIGANGSIGEPCDIYTATGDGGPLLEQTHPQLHSVTRSPSGAVFAVCDKGCDRILTFGIDRDAQRIVLRATHDAPPGSSPRYSAFHPNHPFLFANHEQQAIVSSFRYSEDGELREVCTVSAIADDQEGHFDTEQSDLKIDRAGTFLYDLLRGPNAVSVFAIDEGTGDIERIQTVTVEGVRPRGCAISPDGRFLLIAAQTSDEVLVWGINDDGTLSPTGQRFALPQQSRPGTVTFFTPGR